ncbi:MAG TPA: hypothetical protein VFU51_14935 [Gaiellaceae bacterium]|nr:hypothetical protein [Gaiellaceae bacterium]
MTRVVLLVLLMLAFSAGTAGARGNGDGERRGGDREVRVGGDCARGATSMLRVRERDGRIELRFRLRQTRGRGLWRITVVHENRVSAHATRRTSQVDDSFELRRFLPDFRGSDTVVVHAWGPRGLGCRVLATLPDGD